MTEADLSFFGEEMMGQPGTPRTLTKVRTNRKLECGKYHLCPRFRGPLWRLFQISSKPFRFASIVRSMKETMIYLDGPSDIDFKCRVCKSKKYANIHSYS